MDSLDNIYFYDGSLHGFYTVIFQAFDARMFPKEITQEDSFQYSLLMNTIDVATDVQKAKRVEQGIKKSMGPKVLRDIETCFLSRHPQKEMIAFHFIRLGFEKGRAIYQYRHEAVVIAFEDVLAKIGREVHAWEGFIRFSQLEGNLYYAKFKPKNNVVPLLMPHFASRMGDQVFMIHDEMRDLVGVYDLNEWYMIESKSLNLPAYDEIEFTYRQLWCKFFDTVSIASRRNEVCQNTHMPKWYRANMTEFFSEEMVSGVKLLKE